MAENIPVISDYEKEKAPFNEVEKEAININVAVSYSLSKTMPISVKDYGFIEGCDFDISKDGKSISTFYKERDFSNTNFKQEFIEDPNAFGIPDLLWELHELVDTHIDNLKEELDMTRPYLNTLSEEKLKAQIKHYERVKEACDKWHVDDFEVICE